MSPQELQTCINREQLMQIRAAVDAVHASGNLLDYLQRVVAYTRNTAEFAYGLSPRGTLALLHCAKTWALMQGRQHVVPEDLQQVLRAVASHRLVPTSDFAGDSHVLIRDTLANVEVIAA